LSSSSNAFEIADSFLKFHALTEWHIQPKELDEMKEKEIAIFLEIEKIRLDKQKSDLKAQEFYAQQE
jgi:hypothetical protein